MGKKKKQKSSKNTRWAILRHPIILALLLGIFVMFPYDIYQLYTVDRYGIETVATVYKTTRRSGRQTSYYMHYEFQVNKKWYKKSWSMAKEEYSKGDTVKIKYLPKDPELSFTVKMIDRNMNITKKLLPFLDWD